MSALYVQAARALRVADPRVEFHTLNRSEPAREGRHSPNIKTKARVLVFWRAERAGFRHFTQGEYMHG